MKTIVSLNFICYDYIGKNQYKIFLTNNNEVPSTHLLEDESLEDALRRIVTDTFSYDPKWVLQYLNLVRVIKNKDSDLLIDFSCLVPEIHSVNGRFIKSSNLSNLSFLLNTLRV